MKVSVSSYPHLTAPIVIEQGSSSQAGQEFYDQLDKINGNITHCGPTVGYNKDGGAKNIVKDIFSFESFKLFSNKF